MSRIVHKIVDASIQCGVIEEKDRNLYNIAISSLIFSLITWGTLLLMGTIFGEVYGSLVFLSFHIPLRIFAGGYHQKTQIKCYLQSLIIFGLLMFGALTPIQSWIVNKWMFIMALSFVAIWIGSPVESLAKPLNIEERKHHKMTARAIIVAELIMIFRFKVTQYDSGLYYSVVSSFLVAVQLILGIMVRKTVSNND